MKTIITVLPLLLFATGGFTQTAESLKDRIQEHYHAINTGDGETVLSHHRADLTHFPAMGGLLWEGDWQETNERMGVTPEMGELSLVMRHLSAQIINDVGIATFYLEGNHGDEYGTWRVTAVWVWENGTWMEAHHHESELEGDDDD